jgi:hypothetical protein
MITLSEQPWWTKANRQAKWKIRFGAELEVLGTEMERLDDMMAMGHYDALALHGSYKRIYERCAAIEKRLEVLHRIMARHLERAPDLLPGLNGPSQVGGRLQ